MESTWGNKGVPSPTRLDRLLQRARGRQDLQQTEAELSACLRRTSADRFTCCLNGQLPACFPQGIGGRKARRETETAEKSPRRGRGRGGSLVQSDQIRPDPAGNCECWLRGWGCNYRIGAGHRAWGHPPRALILGFLSAAQS